MAIGQTGVSNLNAGSTSADASGTNTPVYSSVTGNGSWNGTDTYTPTDGSTPASTVSTGMWISIYPHANTITPYVVQVLSVAAGVNGAITCSTTNKFGTAPTSGSTLDCRVGGSWSDFGLVASGGCLNTGTITQSTRINIKAGTYANTSTSRTIALTGTALLPLWWRGYKTTPGDEDSNNLAVAGTDIPSITFTSGQLTLQGGYQTISSIDVTGAVSGAVVNISAAGAVNNEFYRVRIRNTSSNAGATTIVPSGSSQHFQAQACYFSVPTTGASVINMGSSNVYLVGCILSGGIIGLKVSGTNSTVLDCIFLAPAGDAIQLTAGLIVVDNCAFWSPGGNGINFTATPNMSIVSNCYFSTVSTAAKAAIMNSSGANIGTVRCVANAYFNCTANTSGLGDTPLIFDNGTIGGEAFNNPPTDLSIVSTYDSLGFPGKNSGFETISAYTGYLSFGAVQPAPGGGGKLAGFGGGHAG